MDFLTKLGYSLLIGVLGSFVAWIVHKDWRARSLVLFGLIVFVVTFVLTLIIKK